MERREYNINFYEDSVLINEEFVEKSTAMEFINRKRSNGVVKKSKKTTTNISETYMFYIDDDLMKVRFPAKINENNIKYKEKIQKLYELDREKLKLRIKILSLTLSLAFVSGLTLSKPIKNLKIFDHFEILELDNELKDHTGYTLPDGEIHPITEEDHMKNGCSFDYIMTCIEDEIKQYCIEKGLGEEVAEAAIEKYGYLEKKDKKNADKINLHKIYRQSK